MCIEKIKKCEKELTVAMMNHDILVLDRLLDDKLIFVNHFGMKLTKNDDINSHKQKEFKINNMKQLNQDIKFFSNIAIVVTEVEMDVFIMGKEQKDHLIYSRTWQETETGWRIIAGNAVEVKRL